MTSDVSIDEGSCQLSTDQLPLLVTGLAGVPGYNAFDYFRRLYGDQVIGIRQPSMWPLAGKGIVAVDIENPQSVDRLFDEHQFASVLHCSGSCRLKSCELDPAMAHRVNVLSTQHIANAARRHDCRVIQLSIDLVFAGREQGGYREEEVPDPVTVYGAKMVEGEAVMRRERPGVCILRISLPMGISFNGHAGAIDWIASRFKQSKPATLYFDEVRTPTYCGCMNRLFHRLLQHPIKGTFHAGGSVRLSLFQIAQIVNRVGGYDPELLIGCPRAQAGPMPPRAGNVTLDSSKLRGVLGGDPFVPWPFDPSLIPSDRDWHLARDQTLDSQWSLGCEEAVERLLYQNPNFRDSSPPNRSTLWGDRFSLH